MQMIKNGERLIGMIVAVILTVGCLGGCSAGKDGIGSNGKLQIVTTIFPAYDWVMNMLGDRAEDVEVTMLLDNGVDLHSFQPSAADILKISTCDMFVYVGGESDGWVKDALSTAVNKDMIVIDMLEVLGDAVKDEEVVEGMQEECENDRDNEDDHSENTEEPEYDEHVWLSVSNAQVLVKAIAEGLKKLDPEGSEKYDANHDAYIAKLDDLDAKYVEELAQTDKKTILFGDRFPFRYLTDEYGIKYYAAFAGCSAETEASFETIVFLSNKVDELGLKAILTIERSDTKVAETIKNNTKTKDQEILTLDSLQSVTSSDIKAGATYISVMESNLEVLKKALR